MTKLLKIRTFPPFCSQKHDTRRNRSTAPLPSHPSSPPPSPPPSPSPSSSPSPASTPPPSAYTRYPTDSPQFNLEATTMSVSEARRILNVCPNASRREISLRFKILSRKCHPDKWSSDSQDTHVTRAKKFQVLVNARDRLL